MFNKQIKLGSKMVGAAQPSYIVAEVSCNHNNSIAKAKELIYHAKHIGANAIKFQTYRADSITLNSTSSDFKIRHDSPWSKHNSLYSLFEEAAMPWEWHEELFSCARDNDIDVFSSPFCLDGVDLLHSLGTDAYKIASPEIYHHELIKSCFKKDKPVIISLGVAELLDIYDIVEMAREHSFQNLILLKCTASYPAKNDSLNLNVITDLKKRFECLIGYSDHSMGKLASLTAVATGACLIEKHIKLDNDDGIDGFFSMGVSDFKNMIDEIRKVEAALGVVDYELADEIKIDYRGRRSVYFCKPLQTGDAVSYESTAVVRPTFGLNPRYRDAAVGKIVKKNVTVGERVDFGLLENASLDVALIGLGKIGVGMLTESPRKEITTHLDYLSDDVRFDLILGIDPDPVRRKIFEAKTNIQSFSNIDDATESLLNSDIVILADPVITRLNNIEKLVKHLENKIFLLEKPVALNKKEAAKIQSLMVASNNRVVINYQRRTNPYFQYIKRLVKTTSNFHMGCQYTGTFENIGSHFLDLYSFFADDATFSRKSRPFDELRLYSTPHSTLSLESIDGPEFYSANITNDIYNIAINFISGQVNIYNKIEGDAILNQIDNHFYFRHIADDLYNIAMGKKSFLTPIDVAINYLER